MKKLILLTVITILSIIMLSAQEFHIGAKAGVNLATLKPDVSDPATRISFHLGGMVEIPILESFSIQPELLYSAQGTTDKLDDDEVIKLDYLTLPVLAKYYVWDALSVEAGPQFGILLSAKGEDDGQTNDGKDITKSTDIGFALGAGYKLDNGLNFGARYYLGSNVNSLEDSTDKVKNNVLQFSVGYFFN